MRVTFPGKVPINVLPHSPLYRTMSGLVGDLINESYHVLFVNDIHCFNTQIPYQARPSPIWGGGVGQNIDRCINQTMIFNSKYRSF